MEPSCCKSVILSPSVSPESVDQTLDDRRCLIVVFIPQSVGQTEDGVRSDIPIGGLKNLDVLQGAVQVIFGYLRTSDTECSHRNYDGALVGTLGYNPDSPESYPHTQNAIPLSSVHVAYGKNDTALLWGQFCLIHISMSQEFSGTQVCSTGLPCTDCIH